MIYGIGIDIIEISRVEEAVASGMFCQKVYTQSEMDYLESKKTQSFAGVFSAKEAVVKALGTGFDGFLPKEVEIAHDDNDRPYVLLRGKAKDIADENKVLKIHVSISHCGDTALAYAIAECEGEDGKQGRRGKSGAEGTGAGQ